MNLQTLLLVLIAAMLGVHWYPDIAYPAIGVAIVLYASNQLPKWWKQHQIDRTKQKQLDADEPLRRAFWAKHQLIRDKYDPKHEWNEATSLPAEYVREMAELNAEYRVVMDRWFGQ